MNLKKSAIIFGIALGGAVVLINYFSPENIHPILLLSLFCLVYLAVYYLGIISYHIFVNLSRMITNSRGELARLGTEPSTKFKKINFVFSVLAVMLLAMQSLKNVSFYETLLFMIIFFIAIIYIIKMK